MLHRHGVLPSDWNKELERILDFDLSLVSDCSAIAASNKTARQNAAYADASSREQIYDVEDGVLPEDLRPMWRREEMHNRAQDCITAGEDRLWNEFLRQAKPGNTDEDIGINSLQEPIQPGSHPTLTIPTDWKTRTADLHKAMALIDTGCATSTVTERHLRAIADERGQPILTTPLHRRINLISASGQKIPAKSMCNLPFAIDGVDMEHAFYVFDDLPYDIILGMDFVVDKRLTLNLANGTLSAEDTAINIRISSANHNVSKITLHTMRVEVIAPSETRCISLTNPQLQELQSGVAAGHIESNPKASYPDNVVYGME